MNGEVQPVTMAENVSDGMDMDDKDIMLGFLESEQ